MRAAIDERRPSALPDDRPIVSGGLRTLRTGRRAMHWVAAVLPVVLLGYALLDRGFAYIHVPPIPLFAGELVMLISLVAAVVATGYMRRGFEHSAFAKLLLVFAAWGLFCTLPNLGAYGFNAIRDAALWYYSLLAIVVCALIRCDPDILRRWVGGYRRFIPWLLVFSPFAVFLAKAANGGLAPLVPGSSVSLWFHKPGNIAVNATIAIAFLWLIPEMGGRFRVLLTGLATVTLLIVATQNRGGFIAALAGLFWVWVFSRRRGRLTLAMAATVLLCLVIGWGLNLQYHGVNNRNISVGQLVENVNSVAGGGKSESTNLDSTVQFRNHLWSAVIDKVRAEHKVMTGLGFGPDIAKEVGFQGDAEIQLRSPHNSHVDVFARMGVTGLGLWLALWALYYATALRARRRLRAAGRLLETGIIEVCIAGVTAILVNAYFDPTLESPQVAIWLWSLVGITLGVVAISRRIWWSTKPMVSAV